MNSPGFFYSNLLLSGIVGVFLFLVLFNIVELISNDVYRGR